MKTYHVAIASSLGIDTVLVDYEDQITMNNIKLFGEKAIHQACNQALEDLTAYNPKVISWQVIDV